MTISMKKQTSNRQHDAYSSPSQQAFEVNDSENKYPFGTQKHTCIPGLYFNGQW